MKKQQETVDLTKAALNSLKAELQDMEIVADLFRGSFGVMRQVDEDFTSL